MSSSTQTIASKTCAKVKITIDVDFDSSSVPIAQLVPLSVYSEWMETIFACNPTSVTLQKVKTIVAYMISNQKTHISELSCLLIKGGYKTELARFRPHSTNDQAEKEIMQVATDLYRSMIFGIMSVADEHKSGNGEFLSYYFTDAERMTYLQNPFYIDEMSSGSGIYLKSKKIIRHACHQLAFGLDCKDVRTDPIADHSLAKLILDIFSPKPVKPVESVESVKHESSAKVNYCSGCGHKASGNFCSHCGAKIA